MAMGKECAVHVHDDMVPQESHHVWPLGMGGPDQPGNRRVLCSNGHSAVHTYQGLVIKYTKLGRPVPWRVRQLFGHKVRELAMLGLTEAGVPRDAGE